MKRYAGFPSAILLATVAVVVSTTASAPAFAQEARNYRIAPGPLAPALNQLADESGIRLVYAAEIATGRTTAGADGSLAAAEALSRLLAGTGLTFRQTGPNAFTLELAPQVSGGTVQLGPVRVEAGAGPDGAAGGVERALGPVPGYVASRSASATKTDTPLIETPQSISVVTADQISAQGAQSINEALRYTAGIDAEAFGYDARLSHFTIRGFQADNAQFLDGLRLPNGGYAYSRVETYGVERVEVLRGPSSGLYGQNVPGGLINMVSKMPSSTPSGEVGIQTASPKRIQGMVDLTGPIDAAGKLSFRITALGRWADTQNDFTRDNRIFVAPALRFSPADGTSLTILGHVQLDRVEGWSGTFLPARGTLLPNPNGRIPTSRFVGEPGYDHLYRDQYAIGYALEHRLTDGVTFRSNLRYTDIDVDAPNIYPDGLQADGRTLNRSQLRFVDRVRSITVDNRVEAKVRTGALEHDVLAGFDYRWTHDRDRFDLGFGGVPPLDIFAPIYGTATPGPLTRLADNNQKQRQIGVYVQDQIKAAGWILTLGGRYDWSRARTLAVLSDTLTRQRDEKFTGRVGLGYTIAPGLVPYVSYSTSFEPQAGTTFGGTPFVPTTGKQIEGGVKYEPTAFKGLFTGALYQLTQRNVLSADPDPTHPFASIQEGEIRVRGVELEGKAEFAALALLASYTFSDAKITRSTTIENGLPIEGTRAPIIPRHQGSIWLDYDLSGDGISGLKVGGGVRYRGVIYGDSSKLFRIPAYTLFDAALNYDLIGLDARLDRFRLTVNASNIFGKHYVSNCQAGVCYFGLDRQVLATLAYRW